ncbi:fimbria/pilus outer membrane usher protein [Paraburkholderia sp. CNPSo 3155]|uniref:FimD/PapC C-terminal domain-containing protein n=1 Tax=Paraburkholderia atlantica TaxID=2654982 RepID=UPI00128B4CB6|nr:FimD/PapC C-terminal domain-containing protein [Paraburkholderia atlantica]MPW06472.1 fimbria/pilus outer membrane usher protein [Paraburkholderia atlantica]
MENTVRWIVIVAVLLALMPGAPARAAGVGFQKVDIPNGAEPPLTAGIWYPTDAPATPHAVSTDGIAGVPVKLENRLVGSTDDHGLLLVTPLNAWQNNDLSIDPRALPADVSVERVRMQAVPSTGSGMLARFEIQTMLMLDFSVHSVAGEAIPAGTQAVLDPGNVPVTIGYDGRVFLENPPADARLSVPLSTGRCVVALPAQLPQHGRIDLGDQPCR